MTIFFPCTVGATEIWRRMIACLAIASVHSSFLVAVPMRGRNSKVEKIVDDSNRSVTLHLPFQAQKCFHDGGDDEDYGEVFVSPGIMENTRREQELYVQFSHSFQRHVVFRSERNQCYNQFPDFVSQPRIETVLQQQQFENESIGKRNRFRGMNIPYPRLCEEVLASYDFLDDALEDYPNATVVVSKDVVDLFRSVSSLPCWSVPIHRRAYFNPLSSERSLDTKVVEEDDTLPSSGGEDALRRIAAILTLGHADSVAGTSVDFVDGGIGGNGGRVVGARRHRGQDERTDEDSKKDKRVHVTAERLSKWIGIDRFRGHDASSVQMNYDALIRLFTSGGPVALSKGAGNEITGSEGVGNSNISKGVLFKSIGLSGQDKKGENNDNHNDVCGLLFDIDGAKSVIRNFPQLCLYDVDEVEERIRFLVAPLFTSSRRKLNPPMGGADKADEGGSATVIVKGGRERGRKKKRYKDFGGEDEKTGSCGKFDWPLIFCEEGYGAGLTLEQATEAIRAIPELLSMRYEDARKPSMVYFYQELGVSWEDCDKVRANLIDLAGCDVGDTCAMAFLNSRLGVSDASLSVMLNAFPAMSFCDLEVSWEVEGPVRSILKSDMLHFLRRRLALRPVEVHGMIKTHSRLSGYDTYGKIKPTIDAIQSSLGLSSREMRTVVLRMPSVVGMGVLSSSSTQGGRVGTSGGTSSLGRRVTFFYDQVGMSQEQLKKAVLKQPSLLQYSIEESLRPKLDFLTQDLRIPLHSIPRIVQTAPSLLGLSLELNLRATALFLADRCSLTMDEVGIIVCTSPPVLTFSVQRKIDPCLSFLRSALLLADKKELGFIVMTAPRILSHGVETSLKPKLNMLVRAVEKEREIRSLLRVGEERGKNGKRKKGLPPVTSPNVVAASLVKRNPSLLVSSNGVLEARLKREVDKIAATCRSSSSGGHEQSSLSLWNSLRPSTRGRKRQYRGTLEKASGAKTITTDTIDEVLASRLIKRRVVLELSRDREQVLRVFPSVKVAAEKTGISASLLYAACSKDTLAKGRKFTYAVQGQKREKKNGGIGSALESEEAAASASPLPGDELDTTKNTLRFEQNDEEDLKRGGKGCTWNGEHGGGLVHNAEKRYFSKVSRFSESLLRKNLSLVVLVSGRVYPPDDMTTVRGTRRAGGFAIAFPQFCGGTETLTMQLRKAADDSFGMVLPEDEVRARTGGKGNDGNPFLNGLICVGFPYLRPSRRRCDLYACHGAMKVVLKLLRQSSVKEGGTTVGMGLDNVHIRIFTDSTYAWQVLNDVSRLSQWAQATTMDEFLLQDDLDSAGMPVSSINPDLLFPLAQTFRRLVQGRAKYARNNSDEDDKFATGKKVKIEFHLTGGRDATVLFDPNDWELVEELATCSAQWQYNRGKNV